MEWATQRTVDALVFAGFAMPNDPASVEGVLPAAPPAASASASASASSASSASASQPQPQPGRGATPPLSAQAEDQLIDEYLRQLVPAGSESARPPSGEVSVDDDSFSDQQSVDAQVLFGPLLCDPAQGREMAHFEAPMDQTEDSKTVMFAEGTSDRNPHEDHKRSVHIAAEQKRRNNINTGFEELQQLIPACSSPARTTRISKANVLRKAIDYICYLVREKTGLVEELTRMRREVVALRMLVSQYRSTGSINEDHMEAVMRMSDADGQAAQSADPGKPVENPETAKFFIFCSFVLDGLYESFSEKVSVESPEAFQSTVLVWFDECCRPQALRDAVRRSAVHVSRRLFSDDAQSRLSFWAQTAFEKTELALQSDLATRIPGARLLGDTFLEAVTYFAPSQRRSRRR